MDWSKVFKQLDPMALGLGAMSLFGGDDQPEQPIDMRADYRGTRADGVQAMGTQMDAIQNLMKGIQSRGPATLGSYDKNGQVLDTVTGAPTGKVGTSRSPASEFPDIFGSLGKTAQTRAPSGPAVNPTQGTNERDLNQMNADMRGQQWYQDFFRGQGLDPNKVKLSDTQRQQLTQLAEMNGIKLGDRMKFDQAGNMNQKGGFAGMPTWAKVAIGGAPVAGAMVIPGVREALLSQLGTIFGGGAGGANLGGNALKEFAVNSASNAVDDIPGLVQATRRRSPQ